MSEKILRCHSFYGTGLRTMGFDLRLPDGVYVTLWLAICYFPLIPLRRAFCKFKGMSTHTYLHEMFSPEFVVLEAESLSWTSILRTYSWGIVSVLILFGPSAYMFWLRLINGRAAAGFEIVVLLFCACMIGAFPFWKAHRDRKFLESTLPVEIQDHWKKQEELSKKNDAKHWRQSHVLSQWLFASLLLIGLIPGFILAKNMGWGLDAQKVVGLLTAIPIWIAVYLMDRWLVQRRNKKQAQAHENYVHSWEKPQ